VVGVRRGRQRQAHVRRHELHPEEPHPAGLLLRAAGREESLENVKRQFDTDRHVFVGTSDEDAALAEQVEWEYLPLEDAAEAAGWELGDPEGEREREREETREDWP
jgi:hypothetical protein